MIQGRQGHADDRKRLGAAGEELAARFLAEQGYAIVKRNWRCRIGEIDIVAEHQAVLIFIEVRTRRPSTSYGTAKESVDVRKQRKVREAAQYYLAQTRQFERSVRFDVISIEMPREGHSPAIEHVQGAF